MFQTSLDILCPMHLVMSDDGRVLHVAPTLRKLFGARCREGAMVLELFDIKTPRNVETLADFLGCAGQALRLIPQDAPGAVLRGVLVPGPRTGQYLLNLSFGYTVVDAVAEFGLSNADFAATDPTMDMLYLHEAKNMAMDLSRQSTLRLLDARIAAEERAFTDTLTGLKNRRALDHVLARLLEQRVPFAVMQIDLDWFKAVNDTLGHAAGDYVLRAVAKVMIEESRDSDTVARIGGDEFVILLSNTSDQTVVEQVGTRIIDRLRAPIVFEGKPCHVSASIGAVLHDPEQAATPADLLNDADVALYASKRAGRGKHTLFSPDLRETELTQADDSDRVTSPAST